MPTYTYRCSVCEAESIRYRKYDERETPVVCECGGEATYVVSFPNVLRASYPDGLKKTDPAYQRLREQSKLKIAHARTQDRAERARIKKEIKAVNGVRE